MNRPDVLRLLERTLDLPANSLTGAEALRDLDGWDSLSSLGFLAAVDQAFGVPVAASKMATCRTVADLLGLLGVAEQARAA